jgi:hypothetical protein
MKPTKGRRNLALWALLGVCSLPPVAEAARVKAVEYVGDHVFITANPAEIAALDNGRVPGWTRTGLELWVHDAPAPGLVPVCRFYSDRFAPRSLHFFTAFAAECDAVRANPDWIAEGVAFYVRMPEAQGGSEFSCPAGTHALYRWYNGGRGGLPLHALTPYGGRRAVMQQDVTREIGGYLQSGWSPEGIGYDYGDSMRDGIAFCPFASDGAGPGFDQAKVEAGQLDLVKGTRWAFQSARSLAVSFEFPPTIIEGRGHRYLEFTAGSIFVEASWNQSSGQLSVMLLPNDWDIPSQVLLVSFTGRNRVEGCFYEQAAAWEWGWKRCELVVGSRQ